MKLYIARDLNDDLNLYANKPVFSDDGLYYDSIMEEQCLSIDKHLFPEVTFENSPQLVEIKLVKE